MYFTPQNQNNVGVLDTEGAGGGVFTTVATHGDAAAGLGKYWGAGLVGRRVEEVHASHTHHTCQARFKRVGLRPFDASSHHPCWYYY